MKGSSGKSGSTSGDVPKTGEASRLGLALAMVALGLAGLALMRRRALREITIPIN